MGQDKPDDITSNATAPLDNPPPVMEATAGPATTPVSQAAPAGPEAVTQITLTKCDALEVSANAAWDAYSVAVGGKAFNGDPLPSWAQMRADPLKARLVAGWKAAANAAVTAFFVSIKRESASPSRVPRWIQDPVQPTCCSQPMLFVGQLDDPSLCKERPAGAAKWWHDTASFYVFTCPSCLGVQAVSQQE